MNRTDWRAAIKDDRSRELAAPGALSASTAFVGGWRAEAASSDAPACALRAASDGLVTPSADCVAPLSRARSWRVEPNPRAALRLELLDADGAVAFSGVGPIAGEWRGADADGRSWRIVGS